MNSIILKWLPAIAALVFGFLPTILLLLEYQNPFPEMAFLTLLCFIVALFRRDWLVATSALIIGTLGYISYISIYYPFAIVISRKAQIEHNIGSQTSQWNKAVNVSNNFDRNEKIDDIDRRLSKLGWKLEAPSFRTEKHMDFVISQELGRDNKNRQIYTKMGSSIACNIRFVIEIYSDKAGKFISAKGLQMEAGCL